VEENHKNSFLCKIPCNSIDAQFYKRFTHILCSQILLISPRTLDPLNPRTQTTWENKSGQGSGKGKTESRRAYKTQNPVRFVEEPSGAPHGIRGEERRKKKRRRNFLPPMPQCPGILS